MSKALLGAEWLLLQRLPAFCTGMGCGRSFAGNMKFDASNDTEQGRYQNRRVEFHVAGEAAATPHAGAESWKPLQQQPLSAQ